MRSLITHLTAIATLFHLMVGCCGHVFHGDGGRGCQHEVVTAQRAHDCPHGHHHDHGHDGDAADHQHKPDIDSAAAESGFLAMGLQQADDSGPRHECHGCDCVALTDGSSAMSLSIDVLGVAWAAPAIVQAPVMLVRAAWEPGDPPILAEIEPPLFERLLI